tara:strand:+ start:36652 stop:37767 length:1116 start_codon:yes stop_codon:yes gene_type:complete
MYVKKSLLTTAILGAVFAMSGCETIPVDQHEQELSSQKNQYEQQIQKLQSQTKQLEAQKMAVSQVSSNTSKTDVSDQLFPPNAQLGHCYSRVLTPATFRTITDKTLVKAESETVAIIPAVYKNDTEKLLVKEESTKIIAVPAVYKTITEQVMVKPAHVHLKTMPAVYETITEKVIDQPAHTAWKRGAGFQSSSLETRIDNGTGEIMCLVEVPATYKTITKTVLKTPERTVEEKHDPEYKTVSKRVIDTAATTKTVVIPAEYKTVSVERLVTAEAVKRTPVAAVYKDVTSSEKVTDEQLKWAEVLCEDNMTAETVTEFQQRLTKAGVYNGPIDGIYGPLTERAANAYAKRNNLPTGSRLISLDTAKHIGLPI